MACLIFARLNCGRVIEAAADMPLTRGQDVVLDIEGVAEFARVTKVCAESSTADIAAKVTRVATDSDKKENQRMLDFVSQDKATVLEILTKYDVSLKLVTVLRSFDGKKLLVMYTADDRVDFRMLVRELASVFKMRIEMRQISDREEAAYVGVCGVCGQPICCRRFLAQPKQTTVKMAKIQGQALSPNKINGACGKLMCCLQYEHDQYLAILEKMPSIGSKVRTPGGVGDVEYNDCLGEMVAVRLADGVKKFVLADIEVIEAKPRESDDE